MTFPLFIRRLFEMLLVPVVIGFGFSFVYMNLKLSPTLMTIVMCGCFAIILFISAFMLRAFFISMRNLKNYFSINLIAYAIVMLINLSVYYLCSIEVIQPLIYEKVYFGYLFFANFGVTVLPATLFVHAIMIILIFLAPLEMYGALQREIRVGIIDSDNEIID